MFNLISTEGQGDCDSVWTTLDMMTPNASSECQNGNRKTILDLTSNLRLFDSERYVGRILSQKPIKAAQSTTC